MRMQSEMRAANMTWNYYAYGHTVHAFTLMENPIWNGSKSVVSLWASCLCSVLPSFCELSITVCCIN